MESADDFLTMSDTMSSHPESPALPLPTPFVPGLDQYLHATFFHPSLSPQLPTSPSLESTPSPEERKEVKKRERKKPPKLECCTDEQIARRRAQNRRSQRAYRERREAQLQTIQGKINEVELQNEKLRAAYESLRNEVAALRSGAIAAAPKCEDPNGSGGGGFSMGPGQAPSLDYLAFNTGPYNAGGNNGLGWGLGS